MPEKMFPTGDSVDTKRSDTYTGDEIRRVAVALERISNLLESGISIRTVDNPNLDSGIPTGTSPSGANEVMTVSEAAKLLRISLPSMYDLVHEGRVHSLSVGRKILISRSSLMELLQEGD